MNRPFVYLGTVGPEPAFRSRAIRMTAPGWGIGGKRSLGLPMGAIGGLIGSLGGGKNPNIFLACPKHP